MGVNIKRGALRCVADLGKSAGQKFLLSMIGSVVSSGFIIRWGNGKRIIITGYEYAGL